MTRAKALSSIRSSRTEEPRGRTSKIRLAHIIPSIAEQAAGPSYTVPALCHALAAGDADVELHVLDAPERALDPGFTIHAHRRSRVLARLDASRAMRHVLLRSAERVDVFHAHGLWRMPGLYAARAARRAGKPFVVTPRGMLESAALRFSPHQKRLFWSLGQGRALAEAHCLHVTSDAELHSVRSLGLRNPVAVVSNGVHVPPLARSPRGEERVRTILYLGRLHPIKALDRLIDAWAQIAACHPGWQLRLVGPSHEGHGELLRGRVAAAGIPRVSFGGPAFDLDKQRELDRADVFALTSHSENFGMSAAEALASELPVLVSKGTPWSQVVAQRCGDWVENDVVSIAGALTALLRLSDDERASMGARGRAWMERSFGWAHKATQMDELYRWLLSPERRPPDNLDICASHSVGKGRLLGAWRAPW